MRSCRRLDKIKIKEKKLDVSDEIVVDAETGKKFRIAKEPFQPHGIDMRPLPVEHYQGSNPKLRATTARYIKPTPRKQPSKQDIVIPEETEFDRAQQNRMHAVLSAAEALFETSSFEKEVQTNVADVPLDMGIMRLMKLPDIGPGIDPVATREPLLEVNPEKPGKRDKPVTDRVPKQRAIINRAAIAAPHELEVAKDPEFELTPLGTPHAVENHYSNSDVVPGVLHAPYDFESNLKHRDVDINEFKPKAVIETQTAPSVYKLYTHRDTKTITTKNTNSDIEAPVLHSTATLNAADHSNLSKTQWKQDVTEAPNVPSTIQIQENRIQQVFNVMAVPLANEDAPTEHPKQEEEPGNREVEGCTYVKKDSLVAMSVAPNIKDTRENITETQIQAQESIGILIDPSSSEPRLSTRAEINNVYDIMPTAIIEKSTEHAQPNLRASDYTEQTQTSVQESSIGGECSGVPAEFKDTREKLQENTMNNVKQDIPLAMTDYDSIMKFMKTKECINVSNMNITRTHNSEKNDVVGPPPQPKKDPMHLVEHSADIAPLAPAQYSWGNAETHGRNFNTGRIKKPKQRGTEYRDTLRLLGFP